jgi:tetratricopeptide (TPR) repeat protein
MFHKEYKKSLEKFNYIINNFSDKYNSIELSSCYSFMGEIYTILENYNEAIIMCLKALNVDKTYREPYL